MLFTFPNTSEWIGSDEAIYTNRHTLILLYYLCHRLSGPTVTQFGAQSTPVATLTNVRRKGKRVTMLMSPFTLHSLD